MPVNKKIKLNAIQEYRKVTSLSNVRKKKDNFSQNAFLKNNNETNKQEQNICLNPKKNLYMERHSKQNSD